MCPGRAGGAGASTGGGDPLYGAGHYDASLDGLKTTLKLREKYNFPIILLSAKSEDTDKIAGLGFGADDYVTKPFNPLELTARVKSQIRRYVRLGSLEVRESQLVTGGLVLDTDTKEVTVDGDPVRLTAGSIRYWNI